MDRNVIVIKSFKGFLSDLETYTTDPAKAVWFSSVDAAGKALLRINKQLSTQCWIDEAVVSFPRANPYPCLATSYVETSF